jgi:alkylation response protein AidB-like acyl-CoA dehydrogenase
MDMKLSDEQVAVRDLAKQVLAGREDRTTRERAAADPDGVDRRLWADLAGAGLLGTAVPEEHGGLGLGLLELCLLLEEVGRTAADVPALTLALGALPLARFGTAEHQALLPKVVAGEAVVTAALSEPHGDPWAPATEARPDGAGWLLHGTKTAVVAGTFADLVLVPARLPDGGTAVFAVPRDRLTPQRQASTTCAPTALLQLDGVAVTSADLLGADAPGEVLPWLVERATVAVCAVQAGVSDAALRITATYVTERQQFGRSIASFQAVTQRAGQGYVDAHAIRLTMLQAAWRLDNAMPAAAQVAVAKHWAAEGGQRVAHTAQHLHGGVGVDRDYPLHRYFLLAKSLELSLGGATRSLVRLGDLLATDDTLVPAPA